MSILQTVSLVFLNWVVSAGVVLWGIRLGYAWVLVELDEAQDHARTRKQRRTASTGFFITEEEIAAESKIPRCLFRFVFGFEKRRKKLLTACGKSQRLEAAVQRDCC
jgi:hypothetical protein